MTPPIETIALGRLAYGACDGDRARLAGMGLAAWVDEQLSPAAIDDAACDARVAALRLETLGKTLGQLWSEYHLATGGMAADARWDWRTRPFRQVRDATWVRAVYSKRQMFEVMVQFWHNHFNVHGLSEQEIGSTWMHYDRDVIRRHALGNFRAFLEDVARSPAMLLYLDNASNRSGGPNENYARELMELHTLGVAS